MANPRTTARFAETLRKAGLIDELQQKAAVAHADRWGRNLGRTVAELGFADEHQVVEVLAQSLKLPAVHLGNVLKDNGALRALGAEFCEAHVVFPVTLRDRMLTLAMADPTELRVIDQAGAKAQGRVTVVMAAESEIRAAISRHYRGKDVAPPPARRTREVERPAEADAARLDAAIDALPLAPPPPPPPPAPGAVTFSAEELQRLELALKTQVKVTRIFDTVRQLLDEKGLAPPTERFD